MTKLKKDEKLIKQPKLTLSNKQVMLRSPITGELFSSSDGILCTRKQGDFAILPKEESLKINNTM
jgi:hypothetical protein